MSNAVSGIDQDVVRLKAVPAARADKGSARLIAAASFVALTYATVRYNVFKGVPWSDWPAYTVNKAMAFASLILIVATVIRIRRGLPTASVMAAAGALGLVHSLLSFALLNPLYYPKLYQDGKLTAVAAIAMTLGAMATAAMDVGARRAHAWRPLHRHAALALVALAVGLHAALPAAKSWLAIDTWPGGMPPITLLSFLAGVLALGVWVRTLVKKRR